MFLFLLFVMWKHIVNVVEWGFSLSVHTMEMMADVPVMLDQIVDFCYSFVLSGLQETPVTRPTMTVPSSVWSHLSVCVWWSVLLVLGNADKSKTTDHCLDPENVDPQSSVGTTVSTAESDQCGFCDVPALSWWTVNNTSLLVGKTVST